MADEDYMGDLTKFLPTDPTEPTKRKPPSQPQLTHPPTKKKKKTFLTKNQERERKLLQEDEATLQNLNKAIPETNIGYKMLAKMGYKGSGEKAPVGVEIRRGRAGVGREDPVKERERLEREREERERKSEEERVREFGERRREVWRERKVVGSWRKANKVLDCLEDREVTVVVGEGEGEGGEEGEEEEEEVITEEDLLEILMKLRDEHQYCLFCGCKYESSEALLANCPGITEDDH